MDDICPVSGAAVCSLSEVVGVVSQSQAIRAIEARTIERVRKYFIGNSFLAMKIGRATS